MFKISDSMIHHELLKKARSLRRKPQNFSLFKTRMMKILCRMLRGKHSRKMRYAQEYIERPDGSKLRICVYTPLERKDNVPGLLWIHGGGYSIGIPEQDDAFILRFVEASGCVAVSPDYTLSLDKPYPAALEDCYAALLWLNDKGAAYGMRKDQIFVGGNSAGGGLAAAVSLYARDKKEVAIAFQILLYPMLDDRPTSSSKDNDAPLWYTAINKASWQLYLGDYYGREDVPAYAVPARAVDYANLPPACSFVGSIEPFLAETEAYMNSLKNCGITAAFKVFEGCFHAFDQICPDTDIAKEAVAFLMEHYNNAVKNHFAPQEVKEYERI
ncbi:MAG: alpha/beta hydrolase [Lachnospiraceae bacterium]|nr:alpha/beta hydrolase [Lachnospiraceae bacterium]